MGLAMFPLSTVLFPGAQLPLHVFEDRYRALMADCRAGEGEFGVVLISRGSEVGGGDQRVDVGTVARIVQLAELDDGRMVVMARGIRRMRVHAWLVERPYPRATVEDFPLATDSEDGQLLAAAESAVRRLRSLLSELGEVPALSPDLRLWGTSEERAWQLCAMAPLNLMDRQVLLASTSLEVQLARLCELCHALAEDVLAMLAGGLGD